jgi:hypothetical protein
MSRSVLWIIALWGIFGLWGAASVQAQTVAPNIPAPTPVFPLNQPQSFRYSDAQGTGTITFVDFGPDSVTGFDLLQVTITQNGFTYSGSGITTPIPGAARPYTDLVSFTVVGANGTAYFYEGKMGLGVEFQGQGTYHPVNAPTQVANWGLLFTPGGGGPPTTPTLTLGLDRGCGSVYPLGASMLITYGSSVNDTLTLLDQRNGTTTTLFANVPVVAGQTYSLSTFVANIAGPRTLILMDSSGAQAVCSFTGSSVF